MTWMWSQRLCSWKCHPPKPTLVWHFRRPPQELYSREEYNFEVQFCSMKPNKNIYNLHEWKVHGEIKCFLRTQQPCSDFLFLIHSMYAIHTFFFLLLLVRTKHRRRNENPFFSNVRNGTDWHCCHTSPLLLLLTPSQFFHMNFWQK